VRYEDSRWLSWLPFQLHEAQMLIHRVRWRGGLLKRSRDADEAANSFLDVQILAATLTAAYAE
jgi:hypothetical protein